MLVEYRIKKQNTVHMTNDLTNGLIREKVENLQHFVK